MKNPFLLKKIISKEGVVHFKRYGIQTPWFGIYLHFIYKADEDAHLHDHPWDYTSICLKGIFIEKSPCEDGYQLSTIMFGRIVEKKAEQFHKISSMLGKTPVVTLFFAGKRRREWGYSVNGVWVDNVTYRKNKNQGLYK